MIEDLLVLSRAERGSLEVSDEPVLIQRVVGRVITDIKRRQPGLVVELALPSDLPPVRGELSYVEQVLRNLVGNAAKYGPPAGPIRIAGTAIDGFAEIRVLDAGPGISPDDAERVFELFYRSRETAARVSGAGIGLFVCRQLVELMGGRIWSRQRATGGAEFGFTPAARDRRRARGIEPGRLIDSAGLISALISARLIEAARLIRTHSVAASQARVDSAPWLALTPIADRPSPQPPIAGSATAIPIEFQPPNQA